MRLVIRLALLLVAMAAMPAIPTAQAATTCNEVSKHDQAECLVNEARAAAGLPALVHGYKLQLSARIEGVRDWRCGFTHFPCGRSWTDSFRAAGALACPGASMGEALGRGYSSAGAVVRAWLASPEHRAILLSPTFTRIGVAHRLGVWVLHAGAC